MPRKIDPDLIIFLGCMAAFAVFIALALAGIITPSGTTS